MLVKSGFENHPLFYPSLMKKTGNENRFAPNFSNYFEIIKKTEFKGLHWPEVKGGCDRFRDEFGFEVPLI